MRVCVLAIALLLCIAGDQLRLRENMKALRGSADERPLLQRYTRQLDAQETRLDALRQEIAGRRHRSTRRAASSQD